MADVKTSAFMLSSATLMVGRAFVDDVYALTPELHSVGMASEVNVVVDSSLTRLSNGVAQASVDSRRTGVSTSITANVFEMTTKNLFYGQGMAQSAIAPQRGAVVSLVGTTLQLTSDPVPGDLTSQLTNIPVGSTILLQHDDFMFPTSTTALPTQNGGIFSVSIAFAAPFVFPEGSKAWILQPISVAPIDADDLFCIKIAGTLSQFNRPVIYIAPKVRVVKGFQLSFNETQYTSMPWELSALPLSAKEVASNDRFTDFGTRSSGKVFIASADALANSIPSTALLLSDGTPLQFSDGSYLELAG